MPVVYGYRFRKWTQRHEFKSWTRLMAFHIALIPMGKVWIQLLSLHLWINSRADCFFSALVGQLVKQKEHCEFKPVKLRLKLTLCHILPERRGGKYDKNINPIAPNWVRHSPSHLPLLHWNSLQLVYLILKWCMFIFLVDWYIDWFQGMSISQE